MKLKSNKIILGTVQFGLKYGLKKNFKHINKKEALKIFEYAYDKGVKFFDTAKNYNTESLIGEFVKTNGIKDLKLSTKLPYNSSCKNILDNYLSSIYDSLKKTNLNHIETVLVHDLNDLKILETENHKNDLKIIKKKLPINNVGFSIYNVRNLKKSREIMKESVIQFPFNTLNKEFEKIDHKQLTYVRSIFLQGFLINKNIKFISKKLDVLHKAYHKTIEDLKIDAFDYALHEVLKKNFRYYLIGVHSINELKKIIDYEVKKKYDSEVKLKYSKKLIDPRNW